MFGLLRMVVWTMTAIAMLLLFTSRNVRAQDSESNENRTEDQVAEGALAERYEKILSSRPQVGSAFDKLYEFHSRQSTLAELCERLELTAKSGQVGNVFQLLGLLQLRRGLGDDAVASLTRAELLLPNEPLASLYRSRALSFVRQYVPALAALVNAADRKPSQSVALEIVKELRLLKDRGASVEVAAKLLLNLEQQFAASPQVNEKLADCYIELGCPEAALPVYEKLIALTRDPLRRIEVRIQLAQLKKRLGEPQQSLIELEQLVSQVKPQTWLHTSLLQQIEHLTEELHGIEGIVSYYERALLKQPDDVASILRLANILRIQSRFEEARNWVAKAIVASPTQPEALLVMVDLMEETNQFRRASEIMKQLVQLDPTNADYIVRWGHVEARSQNGATPSIASSNSAPSISDRVIQQSNAAAIWRRLLIGNENDPTKAIQVAELLRSISLSDEALKLYEQAVQVSVGKIEFSEMLAEYLVQIDRRDEARKALTSALASAGDNRESLIQLSRVLTRFKFPDEALGALEKACQIRVEFGDLIQLADLQSKNGRLEVALDTLNRAANMAENSADLNMIWDAQIKAYKRVGELPELIVALEKTMQLGEVISIDSLQQLAIIQSSKNQPADAAATALKATLAKPDSVRAWLLTARLQHEAGLSIREIESLSVLCKLDAKHVTDYLQRIATIHSQINQIEQALDTMEQIFALPSTTLQHFQMAASFCLQAKKSEQAVEILRRAAQVFPRDRSAWLMLARQLAELRNNTSSLDAAWRVLDLSRDQKQQREAIILLVTLHQPNIANLLASLKQFGVDHEKEAETDLWSAWALLDSGDKQLASLVVANLVDRMDAKPESLRAAIELAVRDSAYSQAAAIQRRLYRQEATVANQLKLGQLLWLAGDLPAAETEWTSVMRFRSNDALVTAFAKDMVDKANWSIVANFVNLGTESEVKAWDFVAIGIFANIQEKNLIRAAELSEHLLAMYLPADTMIEVADASEIEARAVPLTAKDRLAWLEHAGAWQAALNVVDATRAGYRTNQSNPRASQAAAVRHLAIQRGASLRSNQLARFNVQCFAEARALAVLAKFGRLNQQRAGVVSDFAKYVVEAIGSKSIEQLWDCVLVMEPASYRDVSFTTSGAIEYRDENDTGWRYVDVLDALVDLNEPAALELAINEIVLRRQLQHQLADRLLQAVPVMDAKTLARLQNLVQKVDRSHVTTSFTGHVTLAVELMRSQRIAEGQQVLRSVLTEVKDVSRLATCARQYLSNDKTTQQVASQLLLRAFELELESGDESSDLAFSISSFRNIARGTELKSQKFLFDMIRLQAKRIGGLPGDLMFSDSRSNESRRAYRNFRKPSAAIPDRSSILSTSLRAALIDSTSEELSRFVENVTSGESLTPSERSVRFFTLCVAQAILNEPDPALASLRQAKEQQIATEILSLYEVWLLVANQRFEEARGVLDRIDPFNEAILRECELWKMDLGLKLGNGEEAQRAARALAKLPLSVHENTDVAAVLKN